MKKIPRKRNWGVFFCCFYLKDDRGGEETLKYCKSHAEQIEWDCGKCWVRKGEAVQSLVRLNRRKELPEMCPDLGCQAQKTRRSGLAQSFLLVFVIICLWVKLHTLWIYIKNGKDGECMERRESNLNSDLKVATSSRSFTAWFATSSESSRDSKPFATLPFKQASSSSYSPLDTQKKKLFSILFHHVSGEKIELNFQSLLHLSLYIQKI